VKKVFNLLLISSYTLLWGVYLTFAGIYLFLFFFLFLASFLPAAYTPDSNPHSWLFFNSLIMFISLTLMGFGINVLRRKIFYNEITTLKHDIFAIVGFISTLIFGYFFYEPFSEVSIKFPLFWVCIFPIVFNVFGSLYLFFKMVRFHITLANDKDN
tara:strand:+ start:75 stop:542 length:468 start_codon:yes stop_codon:yes gene_type:complete